jgi:hypothetical protein
MTWDFIRNAVAEIRVSRRFVLASPLLWAAPAPMLAASSTLLALPTAVAANYPASKLVLNDNFATLNTKIWSTFLADCNGVWTGDGKLTSSPPQSASNPPPPNDNGTDREWYNGAAMIQTGPNGLILTAKPDPTYASLGLDWVSGCISTFGVQAGQHRWLTPAAGFLLVYSAKFPTAPGCWPAVWMLASNTDNGEIDFFEGGFFMDGDPSNTTPPAHIINTTVNSGQSMQAKTQSDAGVDLGAAFHTYAVEYIPGTSVKMWLDGTLYGTVDKDVPNHQYGLIINNQIAASNTGDWRTTVAAGDVGPHQMFIQQMQVYSR